jgi:hypothetical protein
MKQISQTFIFIGLLACKAEEEEELIPFITGTVAPEHPEFDVTGEFEIYKAFAFNDQGTFWAYLSSNPETHCAEAVKYLNVGGDPYNPEEILSPGKCNMFIKISDWEGESSAKDDPSLSAQSAIQCAMGEGAFELTTIGTNDTDYYWTGKWWQGAPHGYEWNISGDRDGTADQQAGYEITLDIYELSGTFIHDEFNKYDASGSVSGTIDAYICEGLASTGL